MATRSKRFRSGNKSRAIRAHRPKDSRKDAPDIRAVLRSRFFAADFSSSSQAELVTDAEYGRMTALAEDLMRGRITLPEFRAGLRGEA